MKICIFTIVAKNYIPLANILGDSIKEKNGSVEFKIFVADEIENDVNELSSNFQLIESQKLNIPDFFSLAFKYNLTEFCTAIKPFCFEFLLDSGYNKIVYFDPDIYVFSSLLPIINNLDNASIILTPHLTESQDLYTGHWPEGGLSNSGIYNLGFLALKNSEIGCNLISWWKNRTITMCYIEPREGYFTDQKLMDFVPALFNDVLIEKNIGFNVALWNVHERKIEKKDDLYYVAYRSKTSSGMDLLTFVHFSNLHFPLYDNFDDFHPFPLDAYSDFLELTYFYSQKLKEYNFLNILSKFPYTFDYFSNGEKISKIHRRIFRELDENKIKFSNPFNSEGENSFFKLLKNNLLIFKEKMNIEKIDHREEKNFSNHLFKINFIFRIILRLIGIKKYIIMLKFFSWYFRYENQTFLIKEFGHKFPIKKESSYVNL
jgi:hypothetical protein